MGRALKRALAANSTPKQITRKDGTSITTFSRVKKGDGAIESSVFALALGAGVGFSAFVVGLAISESTFVASIGALTVFSLVNLFNLVFNLYPRFKKRMENFVTQNAVGGNLSQLDEISMMRLFLRLPMRKKKILLSKTYRTTKTYHKTARPTKECDALYEVSHTLVASAGKIYLESHYDKTPGNLWDETYQSGLNLYGEK